MKTQKDRRRSGWTEGNLTFRAPRREIVANPELLPLEFYDEWANFRDGQRDKFSDRSRIKRFKDDSINYKSYSVSQNNKKLQRLTKIRSARKEKARVKISAKFPEPLKEIRIAIQN